MKGREVKGREVKGRSIDSVFVELDRIAAVVDEFADFSNDSDAGCPQSVLNHQSNLAPVLV